MKKIVSFSWLVIALSIAFIQDQCVATLRVPPAPVPVPAPATSNDNGIDLIQSTCKHSDDYNLCVSLLQSDPRSLTADVKGLACIMLDLTLSEAKHADSDVQDLIKNTSIDPVMRKCFFACIYVYELAINTYIPATLNSVNSDSYADARKKGSDAFTTVQTCGRDLVQSGGLDKQPKVIEKNKYVSHLATLSLDIIYLLGS